MYIKELTLNNFRNYYQSSLSFDKNVTVIIGKNGVGKTNILESIYLLTFGKSWKSLYDKDVISLNKNYCNIKAVIKNSKTTNLFIGIEQSLGNNCKKVFKVNEVKKSLKNFSQELKSITFSPNDLEIILLSPTVRRNFLNEVLFQTDEKYKEHIIKLTKIVTARNKILKRIKEGFSSYQECEYYNNQLVEISKYIQQKREELVEYTNTFLLQNFNIFSNSKSQAKIVYKKNEVTHAKLNEYKEIEIMAKKSLFGAQKDDFEILFIKNNQTTNAKYFASRGEQRSITFVLKLGALNFIQKVTGSNLVLLLDDIYSELDELHRKAIGQFISVNQTIITTAEKNLVPEEIMDKAKIIEL